MDSGVLGRGERRCRMSASGSPTITEAVCRSLAAGSARAEVEVLELHRLAADLAQHSIQGRVSLDLREAIAAVVAADGLVVATPVRAASPSKVFDSFLAILGDKVLFGMPVPLALNSGSDRQPPDITQVMRRRLTAVHAEPVPTVVVAGPVEWQATALSGVAARLHRPSRRRTRRGDALAPAVTQHLLRIRSRCTVVNMLRIRSNIDRSEGENRNEGSAFPRVRRPERPAL
ncbi:NAD(P)H-dependent oxidoreductase [Streptomyces werraensis]|uniref:NAD(P)H-dependent oxidoreductase n=1 Tax=Streptomyces werraensis TaxID=68284 RepID=UPI00343BDF1D